MMLVTQLLMLVIKSTMSSSLFLARVNCLAFILSKTMISIRNVKNLGRITSLKETSTAILMKKVMMITLMKRVIESSASIYIKEVGLAITKFC